jgi:F0F1-type ATP synthase membrane subunit b/b'
MKIAFLILLVILNIIVVSRVSPKMKKIIEKRKKALKK